MRTEHPLGPDVVQQLNRSQQGDELLIQTADDNVFSLIVDSPDYDFDANYSKTPRQNRPEINLTNQSGDESFQIIDNGMTVRLLNDTNPIFPDTLGVIEFIGFPQRSLSFASFEPLD